jgi:hypothetical protein
MSHLDGWAASFSRLRQKTLETLLTIANSPIWGSAINRGDSTNSRTRTLQLYGTTPLPPAGDRPADAIQVGHELADTRSRTPLGPQAGIRRSSALDQRAPHRGYGSPGVDLGP